MGGLASGQTLSEKEMDAEYEKSEAAKKNMNYKRMFEIVEPLAKQGHVKSQGRLGSLYLLGAGVEKNPTEGLKWLRLAAEKGNKKAEENIGAAYFNGLGVSKNLKEAIKWFERAAANGNARAQVILADLKRQEENKRIFGSKSQADSIMEQARREFEEEEKAREERHIAEQKAREEARLAEERRRQEEERRRQEEEKRLAKLEEDAKSGRIGEQQSEFLEIVSSSAKAYKKAKNDIKKSIVRKKRKEQLEHFFGGYKRERGTPTDSERGMFQLECAMEAVPDFCVSLKILNMPSVPNGYVQNESIYWVGELTSLTTDKDGDASITVKLSNIIELVSKMDISSDNSMYESLGDLKGGDTVLFSGAFGTHNDVLTKGWFLQTRNMTERGAMVDPTFTFGFTSIEKVEQ